MILQYNENNIKVIQRSIKKSLDRHHIKYKSALQNNHKCIQFVGDDLYIWIRLTPCINDKYIVDISTIQLPLNKRRQHVFEDMFNRLSKCKYVEKIMITSVCTIEMKNWCEKHKLYKLDYNNYVNKITSL